MRKKVVSAAQAIAILRDGDTLCCSGFGANGVPVELILALEKRFLETGAPRDLTLLFGGGPGDTAQGGANRLAREGLIKRVVGGTTAWCLSLARWHCRARSKRTTCHWG